ncbi:MAG: PaaI family thioesterase [Chrysiogenetes bacterium]|nr:PaaI family thioesterase [Chrysiogenetes bacterium]
MSEFQAVIDGEALEKRLESVRTVPFHQFLGLRIEEVSPGSARLTLPASDAMRNNEGILHGGITYALLDVACYCAAAPLFGNDENAVSHDIHVSVLRSAGDQDVELRGRVLKRGRNIIFGESEAWSGGKLIARAAVTKSIVSLKR